MKVKISNNFFSFYSLFDPADRYNGINDNELMVCLPVSHTTDDLIFEWYPPESIPLVVEPLQLPQLELIHNTTEDCTTSYSTGDNTNEPERDYWESCYQ